MVAALLFLRTHKTIVGALGAALLVFALINAAFAWDERRIAAAEARGADRVRMDAALRVSAYEAQIIGLKSHKDSVVRTVDTLWRTTKATSARVDQAIAALPVTVRDIPSVDTLVQTVVALQADGAKVLAIRLTERAAYEGIIAADSAALRAMATGWNHTKDLLDQRTKERDARVTKPKVVVITTAAVGVGVAIGKFILRGN